MSNITTAEQTRSLLLDCIASDGRDEVYGWIRRAMACSEVTVDAAGDVWISGPQVGHWLRGDALVGLVARLELGV